MADSDSNSDNDDGFSNIRFAQRGEWLLEIRNYTQFAVDYKGTSKEWSLFTVNGIQYTLKIFPDGNGEADSAGIWAAIDSDEVDDDEDDKPYQYTNRSFKCTVVKNSWDMYKLQVLSPSDESIELRLGTRGTDFDYRVGSISYVSNSNALQRLGLLNDDTLRLRVEFDNGDTTLFLPKSQESAKDKVVKDLSMLLKSPIGADFIIEADGVEFQCHSAILASRSSFFKAMLDSRMSETGTRRFKAANVGKHAMESILQYMYTGGYEHPSLGIMCAGKWSHPQDEQPDFEIRLEGDRHIYYGKDANSHDVTAELRPTESGFWELAGNISGRKFEFHMNQSLGRLFRFDRDGEESYLAANPEAEIECLTYWFDLISAADQYCMHEVVARVEGRLLHHMDVYNAAIVLRIANRLNRIDLKRATVAYIIKSDSNMKAVQKSHAFECLDRELSNELFESYMDPPALRKRKRGEGHEFPTGSDWRQLSMANLRRACEERGLQTGGERQCLVEFLTSQDEANSGE